eukprot:TRINITY_DN9493_c0_g1_i1.p1 TRINITY_DN9493_c0_g1~~TRINITY_DN9493_c0_g1_i1.p1  ORF type:complete len:3714 (-),score=715.30 TRINITY_DN9493_c0_g1_i1:18-9653(-)
MALHSCLGLDGLLHHAVDGGDRSSASSHHGSGPFAALGGSAEQGGADLDSLRRAGASMAAVGSIAVPTHAGGATLSKAVGSGAVEAGAGTRNAGEKIIGTICTASAEEQLREADHPSRTVLSHQTRDRKGSGQLPHSVSPSTLHSDKTDASGPAVSYLLEPGGDDVDTSLQASMIERIDDNGEVFVPPRSAFRSPMKLRGDGDVSGLNDLSDCFEAPTVSETERLNVFPTTPSPWRDAADTDESMSDAPSSFARFKSDFTFDAQELQRQLTASPDVGVSLQQRVKQGHGGVVEGRGPDDEFSLPAPETECVAGAPISSQQTRQGQGAGSEVAGEDEISLQGKADEAGVVASSESDCERSHAGRSADGATCALSREGPLSPVVLVTDTSLGTSSSVALTGGMDGGRGDITFSTNDVDPAANQTCVLRRPPIALAGVSPPTSRTQRDEWDSDPSRAVDSVRTSATPKEDNGEKAGVVEAEADDRENGARYGSSGASRDLEPEEPAAATSPSRTESGNGSLLTPWGVRLRRRSTSSTLGSGTDSPAGERGGEQEEDQARARAAAAAAAAKAMTMIIGGRVEPAAQEASAAVRPPSPLRATTPPKQQPHHPEPPPWRNSRRGTEDSEGSSQAAASPQRRLLEQFQAQAEKGEAAAAGMVEVNASHDTQRERDAARIPEPSLSHSKQISQVPSEQRPMAEATPLQTTPWGVRLRPSKSPVASRMTSPRHEAEGDIPSTSAAASSSASGLQHTRGDDALGPKTAEVENSAARAEPAAKAGADRDQVASGGVAVEEGFQSQLERAERKGFAGVGPRHKGTSDQKAEGSLQTTPWGVRLKSSKSKSPVASRTVSPGREEAAGKASEGPAEGPEGTASEQEAHRQEAGGSQIAEALGSRAQTEEAGCVLAAGRQEDGSPREQSEAAPEDVESPTTTQEETNRGRRLLSPKDNVSRSANGAWAAQLRNSSSLGLSSRSTSPCAVAANGAPHPGAGLAPPQQAAEESRLPSRQLSCISVRSFHSCQSEATCGPKYSDEDGERSSPQKGERCASSRRGAHERLAGVQQQGEMGEPPKAAATAHCSREDNAEQRGVSKRGSVLAAVKKFQALQALATTPDGSQRPSRTASPRQHQHHHGDAEDGEHGSECSRSPKRFVNLMSRQVSGNSSCGELANDRIAQASASLDSTATPYMAVGSAADSAGDIAASSAATSRSRRCGDDAGLQRGGLTSEKLPGTGSERSDREVQRSMPRASGALGGWTDADDVPSQLSEQTDKGQKQTDEREEDGNAGLLATSKSSYIAHGSGLFACSPPEAAASGCMSASKGDPDISLSVKGGVEQFKQGLLPDQNAAVLTDGYDDKDAGSSGAPRPQPSGFGTCVADPISPPAHVSGRILSEVSLMGGAAEPRGEASDGVAKCMQLPLAETASSAPAGAAVKEDAAMQGRSGPQVACSDAAGEHVCGAGGGRGPPGSSGAAGLHDSRSAVEPEMLSDAMNTVAPGQSKITSQPTLPQHLVHDVVKAEGETAVDSELPSEAGSTASMSEDKAMVQPTLPAGKGNIAVDAGMDAAIEAATTTQDETSPQPELSTQATDAVAAAEAKREGEPAQAIRPVAVGEDKTLAQPTTLLSQVTDDRTVAAGHGESNASATTASHPSQVIDTGESKSIPEHLAASENRHTAAAAAAGCSDEMLVLWAASPKKGQPGAGRPQGRVEGPVLEDGGNGGPEGFGSSSPGMQRVAWLPLQKTSSSIPLAQAAEMQSGQEEEVLHWESPRETAAASVADEVQDGVPRNEAHTPQKTAADSSRAMEALPSRENDSCQEADWRLRKPPTDRARHVSPALPADATRSNASVESSPKSASPCLARGRLRHLVRRSLTASPSPEHLSRQGSDCEPGSRDDAKSALQLLIRRSGSRTASPQCGSPAAGSGAGTPQALRSKAEGDVVEKQLNFDAASPSAAGARGGAAMARFANTPDRARAHSAATPDRATRRSSPFASPGKTAAPPHQASRDAGGSPATSSPQRADGKTSVVRKDSLDSISPVSAAREQSMMASGFGEVLAHLSDDVRGAIAKGLDGEDIRRALTKGLGGAAAASGEATGTGESHEDGTRAGQQEEEPDAASAFSEVQRHARNSTSRRHASSAFCLTPPEVSAGETLSEDEAVYDAHATFTAIEANADATMESADGAGKPPSASVAAPGRRPSRKVSLGALMQHRRALADQGACEDGVLDAPSADAAQPLHLPDDAVPFPRSERSQSDGVDWCSSGSDEEATAQPGGGLQVSSLRWRTRGSLRRRTASFGSSAEQASPANGLPGEVRRFGSSGSSGDAMGVQHLATGASDGLETFADVGETFAMKFSTASGTQSPSLADCDVATDHISRQPSRTPQSDSGRAQFVAASGSWPHGEEMAGAGAGAGLAQGSSIVTGRRPAQSRRAAPAGGNQDSAGGCSRSASKGTGGGGTGKAGQLAGSPSLSRGRSGDDVDALVRSGQLSRAELATSCLTSELTTPDERSRSESWEAELRRKQWILQKLVETGALQKLPHLLPPTPPSREPPESGGGVEFRCSGSPPVFERCGGQGPESPLAGPAESPPTGPSVGFEAAGDYAQTMQAAEKMLIEAHESSGQLLEQLNTALKSGVTCKLPADLVQMLEGDAELQKELLKLRASSSGILVASKPVPEEKPEEKKPEEEQPKGKGKKAPPKPPDESGKGKGKPPPPAKGAGKGPGKPPGKAPTKGGKGDKPLVEPRKPKILPRVALKKLFWTPLTMTTAGASTDTSGRVTVWDKLHMEAAIFDEEELEDMFSEHHPGNAGTPAARWRVLVVKLLKGQDAAKQKQAVKKRLFEENRRRAIWFMLALMPDRQLLPAAILAFDETLLKPDKVELLLQTLPGPDEERLVQTAKATKLEENEEWDAPESFVMMLTDIPQYSLRVKMWSFLNSFENAMTRFQQAEAAVSSALMHVRSSAIIEKLLAFILYVGNYLNGGTVRGQADGFDLDTLGKVSKVKATQEGSLLDFIINQMQKTQPDLIASLFRPGGEYESVHEARKCKVSDLLAEINTLSTQADGFLRLAERAISAGSLEACDQLPQRREKVDTCRERLRDMLGHFERLQERFLELLAWFHMDHKNGLPADEFFATWDTFLNDVKKSMDALQRKKVLERRAEAQLRRANSLPIQMRRRKSLPCSLSRTPPSGEVAPTTPEMKARLPRTNSLRNFPRPAAASPDQTPLSPSP